MNTKMDILTNQELLKDKLSPCREMCPILLDIFLWTKDIYPCALAGFVSFIFGFLWYTNPSVITAVAVFGLLLTLADVLLPLISKSVIADEDWNSEKEKKFSIFVNRIAYYGVQIWNFQVRLEEWKREQHSLYTSIVILSLLTLAWLGSAVNNLVLIYVVVLFVTLLPGLLHRRILQTAVATIIAALGIKQKPTKQQ